MNCTHCGNEKRYSQCCGLKVSSKAWTGVAKKIVVQNALDHLQNAVQAGNAVLANKLITTLQSKCTGNNRLTYLQGLHAWQGGNVPQAYALVKQAFLRNYTPQQLVVNLAKLASLKDDHPFALALASRFIDPLNAQPALLRVAFDIADAANNDELRFKYAKLLIQHQPHDRVNWLNLIHASDNTEGPASAIFWCSEALAVFSQDAIFHFTLASLLERTNQVSAAQDAVFKGSALSEDDTLGLIVQSRLFRRGQRYEDALACIERCNLSALSPDVLETYHAECVLVYRAINQIKQALSHANQMHNVRPVGNYQHQSQSVEEYLAAVEKFDDEALMPLRDSETELSPLFIIGFPRCGSTLLEKLLFNHYDTIQTDECVAIERAEQCFAKHVGCPWWLASQSTITDDLRNSLHAELSHWYHASQKSSMHANTVDKGDTLGPLIDKNLTNITRLPLVSALFPEAPIIKMCRHPLDTVISCFLNKFIPTQSWHSDIERVAAHYVRVHNHWHKIKQRLKNPFIELVYEDVAESGGLTDVCLQFTDQHWQAVKRRTNFEIATPFTTRTASYSQVEKPVDQASIQFGQPYIEHIPDSILTLLQPCIDDWKALRAIKGEAHA
ncbi:tetratricopeptide repeat-containing sulfotransferase family protein [Alteromonas oceanisediminis]|uniref:tetratricopeptide repeat-containing sulfotransferase family protein n=1 Tax=Alteromonas oceanisediminis TaxID=2836180 RepID=UPI001BDB14B8|nr:sulfotransferase [Alteromonas oceanisediminis]MBT0587047.1 sulfotransferase [Alteromonas oceanisediminis]